MMDDNRFFKFLWRFIALIILAGLAIVAIVVGWVVYQEFFNGRGSTHNVINVDQQDETLEEKREVFVVEKVDGHQIYRLALKGDQKYSHRGISKKIGNTSLNVGFYAPTTGKTNWIFGNDEKVVLKVVDLKQTIVGADGKRKAMLRGFLITVVEEDTNGDKRFSNRDKKSIYAVRSDGTQLTRLFQGFRDAPRLCLTATVNTVCFFTEVMTSKPR